jgi:hypothetical protein
MTKWNNRDVEPEDGQWCIVQLNNGYRSVGIYKKTMRCFFLEENEAAVIMVKLINISKWFPFELAEELE